MINYLFKIVTTPDKINWNMHITTVVFRYLYYQLFVLWHWIGETKNKNNFVHFSVIPVNKFQQWNWIKLTKKIYFQLCPRVPSKVERTSRLKGRRGRRTGQQQQEVGAAKQQRPQRKQSGTTATATITKIITTKIQNMIIIITIKI